MRLSSLLDRSSKLQEQLMAAFQGAHASQGRGQAAALALRSSLNHCLAVQRLTGNGLGSVAKESLRQQFEILVLGVWFFFVASEDEVKELAPEPELTGGWDLKQALIAFDAMRALHRAPDVPLDTLQRLQGFLDRDWGPLATVRPGAERTLAGFPPQLALHQVRCSNDLSMVAWATLALVCDQPQLAERVADMATTHTACFHPVATAEPQLPIREGGLQADSRV